MGNVLEMACGTGVIALSVADQVNYSVLAQKKQG